MKTYEKISVGKAKNKWDFPEARKCLKHTQRAIVAGPWTLSEEGDEDRDIVIDFCGTLGPRKGCGILY